MANKSERLPDLREFVKENDQRLYNFCAHMLHNSQNPEDIVLDVFRAFGDFYRRQSLAGGVVPSPQDLRVRLFQVAWSHVRDAMLSADPIWVAGRDTRAMKALDDDLLRAWKKAKRDAETLAPAALDRLAPVDADFKAPVVLRDILGFEDEEVVRILGIRWGVYRHRLHRGRLECREGLKGRPLTGAHSTNTITP